jgi:hypothetical protein
MKAAQMAAMEHMTGDVYRVGCDLEIELNAANSIIRQQQLLNEENLRLQERIKRLEEAGDEMHRYIFDQTNTRWIICAIQWREAKEAKP